MARWIRLNIDFHLSSWLVTLSAEARLAWVMLLCYVKSNGIGGAAKEIDSLTASRLWFVGEESVRQMLIAADKSGALRTVDGEWQVVKWKQYQGDETAADRQRRFKERKKEAEVTGGNALATKVTPTETETETLTPPTPSKARPSNLGEVLEYLRSIGCPNPSEESEKFMDHFIANGWKTGKSLAPVKDWQACARTWTKNAKKWLAPTPTSYRGAYD